ncbi:type II toxin-antitoxin system RelE family toxin [Candidatus Thiosymbion oneisti]|uniref:type II toxin-antitoxin system RelE family toxin n=1 Tax=Candidatus Thiosymbion oneisti TaxID=589554 RepID=UPI00105E7414|nr:type II toxin-antitoxin system RelE/ParE family toxin [Candidatus Thiosymbion oneisti]
MKVIFRKSFARDLKKIKDPNILAQVKQAVEEVEDAASLREVNRVKKLSGTDSLYRIRVGEYRIGLAVGASEVEFVRCLHRRKMYRHFA